MNTQISQWVFCGMVKKMFAEKKVCLAPFFLHISVVTSRESSGGLIKYCVQHNVEQSCLYQVAKSLLPTYKIHSSKFVPRKLIEANPSELVGSTGLADAALPILMAFAPS
jgi:hypothetical protein